MCIFLKYINLVTDEKSIRELNVSCGGVLSGIHAYELATVPRSGRFKDITSWYRL